jgi:thioesterase domain-containing protein
VITALAGDTGAAEEVSALVPLRTGGAEPPLFCVHPVTGVRSCYAGLARHLADRPVYGLQTWAENRPGQPADGLGQMLDGYIAHIRRVQPAGPYNLLGWSLGGNIAHAVACALQEQGAEVTMLAILDSSPVLGHRSQVAPQAMAERLNRENSGMLPFEAQYLEMLDRSSRHLLQLVGAAPIGRFSGPAVFFTAKLDRGENSQAAQSWAPYVSGPIRNYDMQIGHYDMIQENPLAEIAHTLSGILTGRIM